MREVSIAFHLDSAERPARSPARKPSSVSPSGVLIAIPVMTIRLFIDKVDLHDGERADRLTLHQLASADRREIVGPHKPGDHSQFVARRDLRQEERMMDF